MSKYYDLLGVTKNASDAEIKKAFRKKAMEYHPDRNQGDKESEEKFKQVNEAYAVLSDSAKRKQYDMYGEQGFHQRYSQEDIFRNTDFSKIFEEFGFGSGGGGGGGFFSSIFGGGFGGGPQGFSQPRRGQDVEYQLAITFLESYQGGDRRISFSLQDGTARDLTVKIPAGIKTGAKLRINGRGAEGGPGSQPGDLYVLISVSDHPQFVRSGNDIESKLKLKISDALLGGSKTVSTLEGDKNVKIPAGVQAGTKIRLKGLGFPVAGHATKGDFFAIVDLDIPKSLTDPQRELILNLQEAGL